MLLSSVSKGLKGGLGRFSSHVDLVIDGMPMKFRSVFSASHYKNDGPQRVSIIRNLSFHRPKRMGAPVRLAKAIGSQPIDQLLSHSAETEKKTTASIFEALDLKIPDEPLPGKFESTDSYYDKVSRLVVEETRYTIVEAARRFVAQVTDDKSQGSIGVPIKVTGTPNEKLYNECYTYRPLTPTERNNLKAGSVIAIVPAGEDFISTNITFGIIQYGSRMSRELPEHMQPKTDGSKEKQDSNEDVEPIKESEESQKKVVKKQGDRLALYYFGPEDDELKEGDDYSIHFIASILSFQRQFLGCKFGLGERNADFNDELLGQQVETEDDEEKDWTDEDEESDPSSSGAQIESESKVSDLSKFAGDNLNISIPLMNEAQASAAEAFLGATEESDRKIHIVQGPPGTGKTTMTIATICLYLAESRRMNVNRKLLVCGPTNRSVVVLARKFLECKGSTSPCKAVMIGDKAELLAESPKDLERILVFTYLKTVSSYFADCGKSLAKTGKLWQYERDTDHHIRVMKQDLSKTDTREIEKNVVEVAELMRNKDQEDHDVTKKDKEERDKKDKKKRDRTFKRKLNNAIRKVTSSVRNLDEQQVVQDLLASADLIFCTLASAGNMPMRRMGTVSALIVDEASACTEAELIIPLHTQPKKLMLVGDPKQLPATVMSPLAMKYGLSRSLQERLMYINNFEYTLLDEQYRMKPDISQWPVKQFYDGKVRDARADEDPLSQTDKLKQWGDYCWVQVVGKEKKDKNGSTYNEAEAEAVVSLVQQIANGNTDQLWKSPERIRVISFYQAQVNYIQLLLRKFSIPNITVSTVDSSQGCEADIVIVSFVRGTSGHVGFLKDDRRLNVALTRAKNQLICIGNLDAMAGLEPKGGNLTVKGMAENALERDSVEVYQRDQLSPPRLQRVPQTPSEKSEKSQKQTKFGKARRLKRDLPKP